MDNNGYDSNSDYKIFDNGLEIVIDPSNSEFFRAIDLATNTNETIYLTGRAGTGKTTFLKYLRKNLNKNSAVVAYTGVAAVNAGGQTIHSFFKINPSEPPFLPNDRRLRFRKDLYDNDSTTIFSHFQYNKARLEIFRSLEVLIIDEISMVRADTLDIIDKLLRAFSGRGRYRAFGGVQVILIGDVFQLPPIEGSEWNILSGFYDSPFFFSAQIFKETKPLYIELKKIYRQKETQFIDLLNRIRINQPTDQDIEHLNNQVKPISNSLFDQNYIALCSTNKPANEINQMKIAQLHGDSYVFEAELSGDFSQRSFPTEQDLLLKEGAQIMFLKNSKNYFNGKIGKIKKLEKDKIIAAVADNFGEELEFDIEKYTWQNVRYTLNKNTGQITQEVLGSFTQYPIKLAWAITVHKSQGLTFEKVIININNFAPSGLVYVALSRCTSFSNLIIRHPIKREQIKTDSRVVEFATNETPSTMVWDRINHGKADLLYKEARVALKNKQIELSINSFIKALSIRNDLTLDRSKRWFNYNSKIISEDKELIKNLIVNHSQCSLQIKTLLLSDLEILTSI